MDVTSFLLGFQKGKALGGGGNAADVRYVTFMNGIKIEYVKPVATGDDCVDVLTKGLISTPTKDPTVDTVYTYSGWSLTDGGNADANALKAVTENRTVYAAYTSAVRTYTITYYDSDGVTVLETKYFAYGAMPSYTPTKDGFNFDGWVPALATVTGDASYTAQFSETLTFAGATWADIARICNAGQAADTFALGDTKTITLTMPNGNTDMTFEIIAFGHDNLADGSGKANMTLLSKTVVNREPFASFDPAVTFNVPDIITSVATWGTCRARQLCNEFIYTYMPTEVQALVKEVVKEYWKTNSSLETTNDKIWTPSATEFGLTSNVSPGEDGTAYEYFAGGFDTRKKVIHVTGAATDYGTRTQSKSSSSRSIGVSRGGGSNGDVSGDHSGLFAVGFCI